MHCGGCSGCAGLSFCNGSVVGAAGSLEAIMYSYSLPLLFYANETRRTRTKWPLFIVPALCCEIPCMHGTLVDPTRLVFGAASSSDAIREYIQSRLGSSRQQLQRCSL